MEARTKFIFKEHGFMVLAGRIWISGHSAILDFPTHFKSFACNQCILVVVWRRICVWVNWCQEVQKTVCWRICDSVSWCPAVHIGAVWEQCSNNKAPHGGWKWGTEDNFGRNYILEFLDKWSMILGHFEICFETNWIFEFSIIFVYVDPYIYIYGPYDPYFFPMLTQIRTAQVILQVIFSPMSMSGAVAGAGGRAGDDGTAAMVMSTISPDL